MAPSKQTNNAWIVTAVLGAAAVLLLAISLIGTNRNATTTIPTTAPLPSGAGTSAAVPPAPQAAPQSAPAAPNTAGAVTTASGLQYIDEVVGTGAQPQPGQTLSMHYSGYLDNGTKFDSSVDRGQPLQFKLGAGQVIRGWDEGIASMKVGGKRRLIVPPALGYGANGYAGVIPPNARLTFEVELVAVQ